MQVLKTEFLTAHRTYHPRHPEKSQRNKNSKKQLNPRDYYVQYHSRYTIVSSVCFDESALVRVKSSKLW